MKKVILFLLLINKYIISAAHPLMSDTDFQASMNVAFNQEYLSGIKAIPTWSTTLTAEKDLPLSPFHPSLKNSEINQRREALKWQKEEEKRTKEALRTEERKRKRQEKQEEQEANEMLKEVVSQLIAKEALSATLEKKSECFTDQISIRHFTAACLLRVSKKCKLTAE